MRDNDMCSGLATCVGGICTNPVAGCANSATDCTATQFCESDAACSPKEGPGGACSLGRLFTPAEGTNIICASGLVCASNGTCAALVESLVSPVSAECKDGPGGNLCVQNGGDAAGLNAMVDGLTIDGAHWAGPNYPVVMKLDLGSVKNVKKVHIFHTPGNSGNQIKAGKVQFLNAGIWTDFGNIPAYNPNETAVVDVTKTGGGTTSAQFWRVVNDENVNINAGWLTSDFKVTVLVTP